MNFKNVNGDIDQIHAFQIESFNLHHYDFFKLPTAKSLLLDQSLKKYQKGPLIKVESITKAKNLHDTFPSNEEYARKAHLGNISIHSSFTILQNRHVKLILWEVVSQERL